MSVQPEAVTLNQFNDTNKAEDFRRSSGSLADIAAVYTKVKGLVNIEHFPTALLYERSPFELST
ncbi:MULTISPECIES: hypothetical protein [Nostocales]|uniref:Uncharacterized protein n=3 Tax=Nostocales TaxID=1161 RepID=A0A0C1R322_9CYAN|nr:hypothetical protein [Tolypothrix bouteillei]KAF3889973.1 hypothetical protein DA73_0400034305 [Tolypothrix bouteillei VB521301]